MKLLFVLSAFILTLQVSAQHTLRVLFLGNSYTGVNNLPQLLANVTSSTGDSLIFNSNTPGGYTLDQHFADATSKSLIDQGGWDYVVMQEQSQLPALDDYFSAGSENLTHEVRVHNLCARVMFYMTWGRKNGDVSLCPQWPPVCTYEGMDSLLRLRYFEMADVCNGELSPVGKVWNRIRHLYPAIELYQPDESHPSEAGSYAAACCFYAALFKSDPNTITYDYTLPSADAAIIRQVAKEVVYDSLSLYDFTEFNPTALFHYHVGSGYNEIVFSNTSSLAESYLWEFGDGDTSTIINPSHSYINDGTYVVTLHAYDCDLNQIYQTTYQLTVNFCSFTPSVYPDTVRLCPAYSDTLWTQQFDTYQWLDEQGDTIAGANNQYFVPLQLGDFSVNVSQSGCNERSTSAYAESYLHNIVIYYIDSEFIPDTVCLGDTVPLILYPNRPAPSYYSNVWFKDGVQLSNQGDTLWINSSGTYATGVVNQMCPGSFIYQSSPVQVLFQNCNISVTELTSESISVFPQPFKDFILIKKQNNIAVQYDILDISGRKLESGVFDSENYYLHLENLKAGIYFLRIKNSSYRLVKVD